MIDIPPITFELIADISLVIAVLLWVIAILVSIFLPTYRRSSTISGFITFLPIWIITSIFHLADEKQKFFCNSTPTISISDGPTHTLSFTLFQFVPVKCHVNNSDLISLCERYLEYNDLPLESDDYDYLEECEFYEGVPLKLNRCDSCKSSGSHKINTTLFGPITIQSYLCRDCLDEFIDSINTLLQEKRPELLVASQL